MKYTLKDFAKAVGVSQSTVSIWKKKGLIAPDITEGGRKFYSDTVLAEVLKLKGNKPSAVNNTSEDAAQIKPTEDNIAAAKYDDAPVEGKKIIANDGEKISEQNNHAQDTTTTAIKQQPFSQQVENLPREILALPRFVKTRKDNPKAPSGAKWQDPKNQKLYSELKGTIGFVAATDTEESLLFLDCDHFRDANGNFVSDTAKRWFNLITADGKYFAELSQSKKGAHVFAKPTKGKFGKITGRIYLTDDKQSFIEVFYRTTKFCLVTGDLFCCKPNAPIAQGNDADSMMHEIIAELAKQKHGEETIPKQSARKQEPEKTDADLGNDYDLFRADIMLDVINPADLPDNDWLAVNSACKNIGVPYHVVDTWNHRDSNRYNEEENLERWNSATDPSFNIETLHGIAKRFNYEEADARREWYQLHPDQSNDNIVYTRDRIKDCPVNLILPENFIWTKQGITQLVPSKKDTEDFKKLPVTKTPIIITKEFREPTKGTVEYEIALRVRDQWNYAILDGKTLADARQLTELGNYAAIINDVGRLKQFFDALRACNPKMPQVKSYNQTGWIDDTFTTFAYPNNGDCIIRRGGFIFDKALATRGDAELWKRKFIEVANKGGAVASLCIGTALAATLARPLNISNPQTHLQGTSGGGKTALLKFTASIFGNPRELIGTFAATNKNRQLVAAAFCDLPSFYDELETKGKKAEETLSTDVYNFADGKGNQANTRDGNARETFKFGGARLTTGERPILKQHDLRGAYKRLIQLDIHNNLFDDEFAADLHTFAEANFGHYAKQWIQFAQEHMQEIQAKYHHYSKRDPSTQQYEPTHLKSLSISLVAFEFFKVMLGVTDTFDATNLIRVRRYLLDNQLPTLKQIDDTARATESLRDFSASHEKFFMHETVNKPEFDNEFTQTAQVCYGKKFRNGEVAFFRTELTKILEVELGFASADKLINAWHEKGDLRHNEDRKTYLMYINGRNQRMICFKAGVIATAESSIKNDSVAS